MNRLKIPLLSWGFSSSKQQVIPFKKNGMICEIVPVIYRWLFCAWFSGAGEVAQSYPYWQITFLLRMNNYNLETSVRGLRF